MNRWGQMMGVCGRLQQLFQVELLGSDPPHKPHPGPRREQAPLASCPPAACPYLRVDPFQRLVLVGSCLFPMSRTVIAGQQHYLHWRSRGNGCPQTQHTSSLGVDSGPYAFLRILDELVKVTGRYEEPPVPVERPQILRWNLTLRTVGDWPQQPNGFSPRKFHWQGVAVNLCLLPCPVVRVTGDLQRLFIRAPNDRG